MTGKVVAVSGAKLSVAANPNHSFLRSILVYYFSLVDVQDTDLDQLVVGILVQRMG